MNTFIRAVEYWLPSNDRSILEFGGGHYGAAKRFEAASRSLCFGRGEGLPGQAWELGHPVVLKEFEGSYFRRIAAARADGLTCGIAVPIFAGDFLTSVLVIFCGENKDVRECAAGAERAGAIELWKNDPDESYDMTLADGYYGNTGDAFEFISRSTSFRRGIGLPGLAWEAAGPVFIENLGKGSGFLRGDSAVKVGINRGFALPCSTPGHAFYVMAFLSALATPIAERIEIWATDASRQALLRSSGFDEIDGVLGADRDHAVLRGEGPIGQAFLTGVPAVAEGVTKPGHTQSDGGEALTLAAIPVVLEGRLRAVLALYI